MKPERKARNGIVTAVVVCNGELSDADCAALQRLREKIVIAADGGARHLAALDLTPDVIVGDMDSLNPKIWKRFADVQVIRYPCRKDKTDTELAVEIARERGAGRVLLFGAFGGRPDHVLGHISLLSRFSRVLEIRESGMRIRAVMGDTLANIDLPPGGLVSLVPFPEARGVTSGGLEFCLKHEVLSPGTRGISNRVSGSDAWVRVEEGGLLLCSRENGPTDDRAEDAV
ncbi:MAG: thiamine diphosphokinase [Candidatus Aminicenantes bacterium]|nr:thiamine diphosphokinase [Candidatus Aminicenantes bacterium]